MQTESGKIYSEHIETFTSSWTWKWILPREITHLKDEGNESINLPRKVIKFGDIPLPSSIASSHQVHNGAQREGECMQCLRYEGHPNEGNDFKKIMWAYDQVKETPSWNFVPLLILLPQSGKEEVMVEVTTDAHQEEKNARVLDIDGWLLGSLD